jgi:hypothetical protein
MHWEPALDRERERLLSPLLGQEAQLRSTSAGTAENNHDIMRDIPSRDAPPNSNTITNASQRQRFQARGQWKRE